jgi:D-amino-acid dehydrogenase
MKGYSLTLRPRSPSGEMRHSVTDADRKIVFAPLDHENGQVIRAAGIADMVGNDRRIDPKRMAAIRRGAAEALDVDINSDPIGWAGLRPATPDSRPIIGPSPLPGLFLNTGHGGLGWTLACGSARLAQELLMGQTPSIEPGWFALRS